MILRILSYNIHKGFSWGNLQYVLTQMKDALHAIPLDVIFLQEVVGQHAAYPYTNSNWPHESQFEYLADSLWPHHAYGKNAVSDQGHHGNAVLSRFAIRKFTNTNISTNRYESRGVLHAELEIPQIQHLVHCVNVHLNLLHESRVAQVKSLCTTVNDMVKDIEEPLILAGDFNDWPRRLSRFLEQHLQTAEVFSTLHGKYALTFPSSFPLLPLDRIYVRNASPITATVLRGRPWSMLSDHAPLYAELELKSYE